jgi:DNA-directed primase/polymerase protein
MTSFVDMSVYTRNRAFRLYLSSKAGKEEVLLPTGADH